MNEQKPCSCGADEFNLSGKWKPLSHALNCPRHPNAPGAAEAEGSCYADETREPGYYDKFDPKPAPEPQDGECAGTINCGRYANDGHKKGCPRYNIEIIRAKHRKPAPEPQAEERTLAHKHIGCQTCDEKHSAHLALLAENAALKVEKEQRKRNAVNRLHNVCDALEASDEERERKLVALEAERDTLKAKLENEKAEHDITEMGLKGAIRQNKAIAAKLAEANRQLAAALKAKASD